ncbi:MAG: MMPL family transporter [Acidobacteria bacterium]|nr:MMPL family transporter [Acidobacteriota bacterium]
MNSYAINHPRLIILIVFLLTIISAFFLRNGLELDVSPLVFVGHDNQARTDFEMARKYFGPDEFLVAAVVCDDVFTTANINRLRTLHRKIEKLPGIAEVLSLANVQYARSLEGTVEAKELLPANPTDPQALEIIRRSALGDRLFAGNLISKDSRTTSLNILLKDELTTEKRIELTGKIYDLVKDSGFNQSFFAGGPFNQMRATEAINNDLKIFLPLTILLIAALLWLCFRSVVAVILPLITIGIGLVWMLGLMGCFDAHFTVLALMLPTLMLAIGCSYMIHVINQIGIVAQIDEEAHDKKYVLTEGLKFISLPVIVSALTIIAGFLSLAFTGIPAIRTTSIFAAFGAFFTMVLSLTFVPAVLMLLDRKHLEFKIGLGGKMVHLLESTGNWATSNQKLLYILTALIVIISLYGIRRITIDIDYFHFFKPEAETSIGLREINRSLSGAVTFDVILEGDKNGAVTRPDLLRRINEFQVFAESSRHDNGQGIDLTLSVVDFIKHLNRAFHDNDQHHYAIPDDQSIIDELLSDQGPMKAFLTSDRRIARILVRSNLSESQAMGSVIQSIEKRAQELFPECKVSVTGTFVLLNRTSDQIAGDQLKSVTIALITIYLMLSLLFKSLRVGLTALIPNLIPVLFFFGFMGWWGINLNLTTSLVASVVLGLAVDNSVQFIFRFRRVRNYSDSLRESIIKSMRLSGRPIIYANLALATAFAIFALSNFGPIGSFGLLSAVTILGCLIEDLVLLPARLTSAVFRAK